MSILFSPSPLVCLQHGSRVVRRSSARLSSVINELSALTHELSVCAEEEARPPPGSQECKDSDKNIKNNSLRRAALKNLTNKVTVSSARINI